MIGAAGRAWVRSRRGWAAAVCLPLGLLAGCKDEPRMGVDEGKPVKPAVVLGGLGDTPGRFAYPRCVEAGADSLWVIDKAARVQEIDPANGKCLTIWRMPAWDLGKPVGFTIAPGPDKDGKWIDGLLYIADTHYHRVVLYEPPALTESGSAERASGRPREIASFGSYGDGPGQFYYPTDVAVAIGADGKSVERIFVSEYGGNDRVNAFDKDYNWLFSFGREGSGRDPNVLEFNRPQSIAIRAAKDGARELVVADSCNHRVGRFTLDGKLIAWIGSPDAMRKGLGQFTYPYGVHVLSDGTALIAEFGNCRVQRVELDTGKGLQAWGAPGRGEGELAAPWAVTTLRGNMYILDSGNNRILGVSAPRLRS